MSSYRFGPFRIEPLERRLVRGDTPVPLTPKAFDLLLVLVENAGRLLQKDELMKRVWQDAFVEEANLANNISTLRKVLGDQSGGVEYIETVPRRGYRFLATVEPDGNSFAQRPAPELLPAAIPSSDVQRRSIRARQLIAAALGVTVLVIATIAMRDIVTRGTPLRTGPIRFTVAPPLGTMLPSTSEPMSPSVSPDGAFVVFGVLRRGEPVLAIRALDAVDSRILAGSEGGRFPFWSPDSRVVAFFANGKLKKVDVAGGTVQTICDAVPGYGGTWNRNGEILFAPSAADGLFKVPSSGGEPVRVTTLQENEVFHQHPQFLPDGRRFLYFAAPDGVYMASLDGGAATRVLTSRQMALYSSPGYIVFLRNRALFAQQFDADRVRLIGEPMPLASNIRTGGANVGGRPAGGAAISLSESGLLAYGTDAPVHAGLAWFNRAGRLIESIGPFPFEGLIDAELSPDASRVAIADTTQPFVNDIWVFEFATRHATQVTFHPASERRPMWSPDGRWLTFVSARPDAPGIYQKMVTGEQPEQLVYRSEHGQVTWPSDWTGSGIFYETQRDGTIWMLPDDDGEARAVGGPAVQPDVRASPNAEWLAYTSDESRRPEVIAQSIANGEIKHRISSSGGSMPRWRPDGKELFYLSADGVLMAVETVFDRKRLRLGIPQPLFGTELLTMPPPLRSFGVTPDGQRFLIATAGDQGPRSSLVVVTNWTALVQRH